MRARAFLYVLMCAATVQAALVEVPQGTNKWSGHLRSGTPLQVTGGAGDVDIDASKGDAFTVATEKMSDSGITPRLFIDEEKGIVCLDWMSQSGSTRCGNSGPLTGKIKDDATVALRITVPVGTPVNVRVDHGFIRVAALKASVTAHTYQGNVSANADGEDTNLQTESGNSMLWITPESIKQKIRLSIDGDIVVVIPRSRRVHYHLYADGDDIKSAYELRGLSPERRRDESSDERAYRRLTKGQYEGTIRDGSGEWAELEIFNHKKGSLIDIRDK